MLANAKQQAAYDAIAAALPCPLDASKITITPGVSYVKSPVKAHDYAAGVMAAFGSVVEHHDHGQVGCEPRQRHVSREGWPVRHDDRHPPAPS
jgi:hypothetical protein